MVHMVCCRFYCIFKADINLEDSTQNSVEMNDWRLFVGLMPVVPALGIWGRPILSDRAVSSTQWGPVLKRKGNLWEQEAMLCAGRAHIWKSGYTLWRGLDFFFKMKSTRVCLHRGGNETAGRMKIRGSQRAKFWKTWKVGQQSPRWRICEMYSRSNNLGKIQTGCVGEWFSQGAWISFD